MPKYSSDSYEGAYDPTWDEIDAVIAKYTTVDMAKRLLELEHGFEMPNAIWLAKFFHDAYERLAPQYGYETRQDTKQFDHESPNGRLMAAVCEELRKAISQPFATRR